MTVYIVDIEAVETRYTAQWKKHLPKQIQKNTDCEVITISGGETPQATTPGAFLNFGGTNVYKSKQLEIIAEKFCKGEIKDGDYFLYTDAWNPTVVQLKYMAELLGVKIKVGGMWHAGSYDPADFLGRLIGNAKWVRLAEQSMFECYDHNYFATDFHIEMWDEVFKNITHSMRHKDNKVVRTGWPMEYMHHELDAFQNMKKKDIILFPHRIAPEKQPEIFYDLKDAMPQYEFIVCQEKQLKKHEYHNLLGEAKLVFSANLQETLGISGFEGLLVDTIAMVPDRLSYTEMFHGIFRYPTHWTETKEGYKENKQFLIKKITEVMENYDSYQKLILKQKKILLDEFFTGDILYKTINESTI